MNDIISCIMSNMHLLWGGLMIAIGLFMLICSIMKTDFIIYRLLVARSKLLWKENVHWFYRVLSSIIIVFGALIVLGIIKI